MKTYLSAAAIWLVVFGTPVILSIHEVEAADIRVTPSVRLGQGWDSNVYGTKSNEISDFYTIATPELILEAASPTFSMGLRSGLEGRWYYEQTDLNSYDYTKFVRLYPIEGWKPTARFSVLPEGYFLETMNRMARSSFLPVDPSNPALGITIFGLQKTRDFGASLGLRYQVNPRVEVGATAFGAERQYPDQPDKVGDSRTAGGDASVRHAFNQKSSGGLYGTGSLAKFETTPDVQMFKAGFLARHQFSPYLLFDARFGVSFARQKAGSAGVSEETSSDPTGDVNLVYSDNTFRVIGHAESSYSALNGTGQVTRLDHISMDFEHQIEKRWMWSIGGHYEVYESIFAATNTRGNSFNGTGAIRYSPWDWGTFDLTGSSTRLKSDEQNLSQTDHSVSLGFTVGKTYTAF